MALMMALPSTPWAYAARTIATAVALVLAFRFQISNLRSLSPSIPNHALTQTPKHPNNPSTQTLTCLFWGLLVGLLVFGIWVFPEQFAWYRKWCILGEGGTRAIAESDRLTIALRLVGSAFVISVAEELFFRKWLIGFAGFGWMVALFAIEHDRWVVGAVAGVLYGLLYLKKGLLSAIVAHAVTNLVLGLYVLKTDAWQFW
jgi:CAAX prenyl protease-like protein